MSKKIFCAQDWETPHSEIQTLNTSEPINSDSDSDILPLFEHFVQVIEEECIDIVPAYDQLDELGYALAHELGESGRSYFHRISRINPSYEFQKSEKEYDDYLCSENKETASPKLIDIAKDACETWGVHHIALRSIFNPTNSPNGEMEKWGNGGNAPVDEHSNDKIPISPNLQCEVSRNWVANLDELPRLVDEVYENLPPFLAEVVSNSISNDDRDVVFLGALATLSVCFSNVHGDYDCHDVYPNLYLFVVADAGQGKGSLAFCRDLVVPINKALREKSIQLEQEYRIKMAAYQNKKKSYEEPLPEIPPNLMLIIPANSSASAFLKILSENNGNGLLFETEGDTLSNTLKSDFGNYSDALRKAFHHEPISFCRRTDREYCEVDTPRLSVVLSGTPKQVKRLIPDAENGLESRFFFYRIPFRRTFRNVLSHGSSSESKSEKFKALGERLYLTNRNFSMNEYVFVIPEHLHDIFHKKFESINNECCDQIDNGMQGIIRRVALIIYRIMMILTCVRYMNQPHAAFVNDAEKLQLNCCDEDFHTAMLIADTLVYHVVYFYRELSDMDSKFIHRKTDEDKLMSRRDNLFEMLPDEFDRKEFNGIVVIQGVSVKTAEKWLNKYISEGLLQRVEQGRYKKLNIEKELIPSSATIQ